MMKKKSLLLLMFLTLATIVNAQITTASMNGKATDPSKEALIGATVKATHTPTGTVYYTVTQTNGSYVFQNLRIGGPYTIEFSYIGYVTEIRTDFNLSLGEELTLNVTMREDSQALDEVVVVGDRNPIISSSRTGAQEIITRDKMDKLPTINRSLNDFTKLTPMSSGNNFGGVSYRFNNVTVDGASFNNSFGLSSALGASGTEPISLEALEQVQVMIAPYDVRNGGFTGAGINSVTKSGDNELKASAYMYTKSPSMRGYRIKDENPLSVSEFSNHQYGVSISGPIIKNKLFFYVNGEIDRQERPVSYTTKNSRVKAEDLTDLSKFLVDNLDYNPGAFDVSKTNTEADRLTARLDWNVNSKNLFSVKYYYLKSFNTNNPSTSGAPSLGRGPNANSIPYSSVYYRTNNNFNIIMADLSTTINSRLSNYLKVGYSRIRDFRDVDGGFFPQVDILNGDNTAYTTFGTEANSYNNQLNTDIWQIQDNFIINLDKHQITIGTQSDYRKFLNGFAQNYPGAWVFSSIADFKYNVLATQDYLKNHNGNIAGFDINNYSPSQFGITGVVNGGLANSATTGNTRYVQKYSMSESFPYAAVDVVQLGFYAQDKWSISDKLNLTFGLRVDIPIFLTDLPENPKVAGETYRDGIKVDVSKYPNAKPQFSPRFGFNYQPFEDGSLQIRGGTGLFTGTPPYVWLSNQAGNNGILFGDVEVSGAARSGLGFTGDLSTYIPASGAATRADISVTDPDFKYPSLWKSNLAADYKFGNGWIATVEMLYSKDINAIYHDNIALETTSNLVKDGSKQPERMFYTGKYYSDLPGNDKAGNAVVLLRNTSKGYSFYTTLQLQKTFSDGILKGLYLNGSYSFGAAQSVTDGSSSVAYSAWRYRAAVNPNSEQTGYTLGAFDGRLLLSGSYTAEWGKNHSTSFGLIYQRYRPFRFSYCYNGDANGDGQTMNDLIYIPRSFDDAKNHLVAGSFSSVEEAWTVMNAFIEQDDYLSKNRGKYAERNGAVAPFANQVDLSIHHDIKVFQKNGRPHTLRFSFDIENFLNLVNKDWGVSKYTILGNQQYQLLRVAEKPSEANNYTLKYEMYSDKANPNTPLNNKTYKNDIASYWQMQFGIKYMF